MRIKTQLIIAMVFFSAMLLVIGTLVIITNQKVERLSKQEEVAHNIERAASDLSYLSNEYLLYRESQHRARWETKFSSVSNDLSILAPDSPEQQAVVNNIKGNQQRLRAVFAEVVSALEGGSLTQDVGTSTTLIQVSSSRMAVQNQGMFSDALRLSQMLRDQADQLRQTTSALIFALIGLFVAFLFFYYILTFRRTLKSISHLRAGTAVIGSGNLDFKVEEKHNDEIGDLSRAFNRMTANLKSVTASKAELEREVVERTKAEDRAHRQKAIHEGINRILEAGLTCDTEEELGRTSLAVAEQLTGSRFGFLGELNAQERLDDIAISDPGWSVCRMSHPTGHRTVPTGFEVHGIYGRVLLDGKGFFTNDPASHPDHIGTPEGHPLLKAFLGVPLIHGGKTIGMVAMGNREGGYSDEDLGALETLAPAIVQVFMRMRAEAERQRLLEELQVQNEELQVQSEEIRSHHEELQEQAEEIQAHNEELRVTNEELAQATKRAEEAARARDEFLSVAAHELKTPVTSLRGFAQTLLRQHEKHGAVEPERLNRALQVIDQQSNKLIRLVSQLLDTSRLEGGRLVLGRQHVDLVHLVEEVATAARLNTTRHTLVVEVPSRAEAFVDTVRIEQVITNLVDNAIRYSPDGGPIEIKVAAEEGSVQIAVRDHGLGIPPEHCPHVFDRFYRAHEGGSIAGLGLGLFISKEIVTLHGGRIEVECPPDSGTRFVVSLPVGSGVPDGDDETEGQ